MQTKRKADDITEEIHEAATADADVAIVPVPDTTTATATPTVTIPEKVNDTNDSDPLEPKAAKDDDVGPQELDDDDKDDYDDIDSNPLGKRRFFPRVKHLLTREWEQFLAGVLDALEQAGAPQCAAASHKQSNPWFKAFDLVYSGVAQDCSIPHGKNRYHKFKDKIVELWMAMEQHAADDHPLKGRSNEQLEFYRKAVANQAATPKKEDGETTSPKQATAIKPPGTEKPGVRRSYFPNTLAIKWKHLNEAAALELLPAPLKNLTHIRHLTTELGTNNRGMVEEQYEKALEAYLREIPADKQRLFEKSNALAVLHRYAQTPKECKDILDAFELVVGNYCMINGTTSITL